MFITDKILKIIGWKGKLSVICGCEQDKTTDIK